MNKKLSLSEEHPRDLQTWTRIRREFNVHAYESLVRRQRPHQLIQCVCAEKKCLWEQNPFTVRPGWQEDFFWIRNIWCIEMHLRLYLRACKDPSFSRRRQLYSTNLPSTLVTTGTGPCLKQRRLSDIQRLSSAWDGCSAMKLPTLLSTWESWSDRTTPC